MNCGSASSVSPYLSGQYVNNNLSQVLAVSWGQPTDADRLKSWWLYYQDSRDMYLLRIQENTSYRVYATFDDTAKLKKSTRDYYKHWDLIPAGE